MTRLLYLLRLMMDLLLFFAVGKFLFMSYNSDVYSYGFWDVWAWRQRHSLPLCCALYPAL